MKKERVILGKNCSYSADSKITGVNNNRVIVGGSGCGKTVSILEPELLELLRAGSSNMIVVATKRRLVDKYRNPLKNAGYTVYDLNFAEPENSNCCYDPLKYTKTEEDITDLASAIVLANAKKSNSKMDPFWDDSASSLLTAECAAFLALGRDCFADVVRFQSSMGIYSAGNAGITTSFDKVMEEAAASRPEYCIEKYWNTFRENPDRTARCIYTSLNTAMDKMFTSRICKVMKTRPVIDFQNVANEKSVIFVTTSPVKKSLHALAQMFISQAVKELFEIAEKKPSGTLKRPVHISFDDFATGGRCANFPEYISIFREKGMSSTILLQSEAQLHQMYGSDAITILDNCDSYVYLGGNNIDTAKSISIRLNVPVNEVLHMPVGREIVFRRGQQPVVTERYDVFQDEDYRRITREYQEEVRKSEEVIGRIENRCQSVRRARMNRLLSEEGGEVEIREVE